MHPTKWDNEYFQNLFNYTWVPILAPGINRSALTDPNNTNWQWHVDGVKFDSQDFNASLVMLTSDLAVRFFYYLFNPIIYDSMNY
jgi:catalase (peroxidase I)